MPRKKPPATADPDAGAWRVILEEVRAQMGVFGDALNAGLRDLRTEMVARFDSTDGRLTTLEMAVHQNSADIRTLTTRVDQNGADIRGLTTRVEKLETIEERVTAIEQRRG
jgi:hypothetical protein